MKKNAMASLVVVLAVLASSGTAMAESSFLTTWKNLYGTAGSPGSLGTSSRSGDDDHARCALCHDTRSGPDFGLNAYGNGMRARIGQGTTAAIRALETLTSTNIAGGTTNLDEIRASAQPGWTTGNNNTIFDFSGNVEFSNVAAPTTIGPLDPPAAPANQPPVLAGIGNRQGTEGQLLQFTVTATDPEGSTLRFTGANLPTGASLVDNLNGTATFRWTPSFAQAGNYPNVTVTVTDAGSPAQSDSEAFTITVGNVNRPPVLGAIGNRQGTEGQLLQFTVTATDPDGNALSFTLGNPPTGASLTDNGNGTATFRWTPSFAQAGNYANVTVTVTDAGSPAQSDAEAFTITVGNVNRPPVLAPIGNRTVTEGQLLRFTITASDPDGDALRFTAMNLPTGASLTDNGNGTATFSWTPAAGQAGNYPNVTVTVTDAGSPARSTSSQFSISTQPAAQSVRGDFNGDLRADILWRNSSSGENYLYPMDGTTILPGEGFLRQVPDLNWRVAGLGDYDGDGKADILWRNSATGENYMYLMNATATVGEGYLRTVADQNWQVAGSGDYNGDGRADILWRNSASGENYVYLMSGTSIIGEGYLRTVSSQDWRIAGSGDFNGDGTSDILWRNVATGENYMYLMNGTSIIAEGALRTVSDLAWKVVGVGDFNNDGNDDILWRNSSTGENYLYPMSGRTILPGEGYLRTVPDTAWNVVQVSDFDGDGKADVLWRNSSSGENYLYPMDGTAIKPTEGYLRTVPDPHWRVQ